MSFTIRSLFQQGTNDGPPAGATAFMEPGPPVVQPKSTGILPTPVSSPFGMEVPPASPFGGSLFKAHEGDAAGSAPIQARGTGGSPFSPDEAGQPTGLTVGDVLPQLPAELARTNSLHPDQPISIAPHLIEAALSNGQAAIPIFEIYRVCPAIFMTPVSPQDSRLVPLPRAKLPALIAAAQSAGQPPARPAQAGPPPLPAAQSPFGSPAVFAPAPFADYTAPPARAQSVPPMPIEAVTPHTVFGAGSPFGSPAVVQAAPGFSGVASPFAAAQPTAAQPSPFSFQPTQPQAAAPSWTNPTPPSVIPSQPAEEAKPAREAPAAGSPFSAFFGQSPPSAQAAAPSPFAMPTPTQAAEPAAPAVSPFGTIPFAQAAPPPFALTEPDPAPARETPALFAPTPAPTVPSSPSPAVASNGVLKLSLATLVQAYPAAELGFEPSMVPSWITTSVQLASIQTQIASGNVQVELGQLIDATTDVGFRNVLSSAHRTLMIKLPASELSEGAPPPAQPPSPGASPLNPFAAAKAAQSATVRPPPQATQAPLPAAGPIQPKPNANFDFSLLASASAAAPANEAASLAPVQPRPMTAFDPFAAASAPGQSGPTTSAAPPSEAGSPEGFSSEQLFGEPPSSRLATPPPMPAVPEFAAKVPVEPALPVFTALPGIPPPPAPPEAWPPQAAAPQIEAPQPSLPPALAPSSFFQSVATPPAKPFAFAVPTATPEAPPAFSAPVPPPAAPVVPVAPVIPAALPLGASSVFGITPVAHGDPEQLMLRALLGVNEDLTVNRVVDLISQIPGIAACSCVNGTSAVSHGGSSQTAQDFQRQSGDLARSIHALAPLIGITDAETFSINTNERLMTFSFHPPIALGVLHQDNDLASGLRDKITLVGRELARMVSKTGGHIA